MTSSSLRGLREGRRPFPGGLEERAARSAPPLASDKLAQLKSAGRVYSTLMFPCTQTVASPGRRAASITRPPPSLAGAEPPPEGHPPSLAGAEPPPKATPIPGGSRGPRGGGRPGLRGRGAPRAPRRPSGVRGDPDPGVGGLSPGQGPRASLLRLARARGPERGCQPSVALPCSSADRDGRGVLTRTPPPGGGEPGPVRVRTRGVSPAASARHSVARAAPGSAPRPRQGRARPCPRRPRRAPPRGPPSAARLSACHGAPGSVQN
ncbi:proline-rich protein 2-like [Perognathus longimembris pacificus]|uniref:proline-rich protein 2-like n=1 Tax=Perognathus longimembris pacificus TaxID=214514 RepID=UPI00201A1FFE|nr:proline-rich protein 2-like [Perognathus longimembris pacificus]